MKEAGAANARFRSEQNTAIARIRGDKDIKEILIRKLEKVSKLPEKLN